MFPGVSHAFARHIENVQNLSITVADGVASGTTAPSPAVDWERTIIVLRGWVNTFGGGVAIDWPAASFYLDVSGANLRMNRNGVAGDGATTVYVSLVQFRPGVVRSIVRGTITNAGVNSNTAALSSPVDLEKTELRFLGARLSAPESGAFSRVEMQDDSTVRHIGGSSTTTAVAGYELVTRY